MHWLRITWLGVAGLMLMAACSEKRLPPMAYTGPTLVADDLGLSTVPDCPGTGYVILESTPSQGRFPAALAVARLGIPGEPNVNEDPESMSWRIRRIKEEKATYWNALFNTIPQIRAVVVMDDLTVAWPDADLDTITASAENLKTGLVLIHGPRSAEWDHAGLVGVIRDTHTNEVVAFVQADAGPSDFLPAPDYRFEVDQRHEDVNYLVARKFDWQVRRCVYELVQRDKPIETPLHNPWEGTATQPANPNQPVYIMPYQPYEDFNWVR